MNIDGHVNVKYRILIFNGKYFKTYRYIFENGNEFNDTVDNWIQTDKNSYVRMTIDEKIEKNYWKRGFVNG